MQNNWLRDLARTSLGDFEVSVELDHQLSELAEWAQLRSEASFELFGRLAWKIERFVRRIRAWNLQPYDLDDVTQEAYVVFVETIRRWRPRYVDGAPVGYLYYFLKVFPNWLANSIRSWRRPARPPLVHYKHSVSSDSAINDFCRNLEPQDSVLIELRVQRGLSITRAAQSMGIARRTAYRRWHRILELGREYLREAG